MSAVVPLLPTPFQPLAPGEALVLWALRLGAAQPANGPVIDQELSLAYGPLNGPAAAGALERLAGVLERHGRRRLRLAHPAEGVPTQDERSILLLLAASQARDWALRDALLLWLVLPAGRDAAAAASITLGAALKQGGHALPSPA
ncbi:MAG: hypothetical protein ACM3N5_13060, partial [Candidatus Eiseniibacteriota bacterium]